MKNRCVCVIEENRSGGSLERERERERSQSSSFLLRTSSKSETLRQFIEESYRLNACRLIAVADW